MSLDAEKHYFHLREEHRLSAKISSQIKHPVKVFWSNSNKNYVIYDKRRNTKILEFETGRPIETNRIKNELSRINRRAIQNEMKENKEKVERSREKVKSNRREFAKELGTDYFNYRIGPHLGYATKKKSFMIEKK